jgi:hypothetical protein
MDANDYALKVTPAGKSLGVVIRKAQWLGKGEAPTTRVLPPAAAPTATAVGEEAAKGEIPALTEVAPVIVAASVTKPEVVGTVPETIPALPASPLPASGAADIEAQVRDEEIVMVLGDRRYRIRGLAKNLAFDVLMKVNVLIDRGEAFYVDTLDLYSVRARNTFIAQAAAEIQVKDDVIRHDLGKVLRKLEELQEKQIAKTLQPTQKPPMPAEEQQEALGLLKDPHLLDRLLADFTRCGVVGEETNKLIGYLAATSRKLDAPLAVMVQSSSAAGKSSLMEAVPVLYGRSGSEAQDPRACRGGRRRARELCAEALAERRRAQYRLDRQRSRDRQTRHARIPGRRPGDDLLHEHRD